LESFNLPGWHLGPRLPEVRVPVLITRGRDDWVVPLAAAEETARRYPNSRLDVFENSAPSPQIEEAALWETTVGRFPADRGL
jgi:proline iminopeptidase